MGFATIDYLVVILYMAAVTVFGIIISGRQRSTADYFLGGHRIPWWAVLFSVVATETSTLTFISIPAVAYGGNLVLIPKLTARIFGLKSMGAIFGGLSVADGIGFATGALLAGYIFDVTGSYHASFLMVAGGMFIAVILAFMLKEIPRSKQSGSATPRV